MGNVRSRLWIALLIAFVVIPAGCTSRSNKIADAAFERGNENTTSIVHDLYVGYTQMAVDRFAAAARAAAREGNEDAAAKAVLDFAAEYDKITWLAREQYGRSREVHRIAQRYIWQQRGWGSVLYDDWIRAEKEVAKEENP